MEEENVGECVCCRQIKKLFCFYLDTLHPICEDCYIPSLTMWQPPALVEEDLGPVDWLEEGF